MKVIFFGLMLLISASCSAAALEDVDNTMSQEAVGVFTLKYWDGPALDVFYIEPENLSADAPIIIVMHGASRTARAYRDNWIDLAYKYGFAIYAPHFDMRDFPASHHYHNGGPRLNVNKSFPAIEPLFDSIKKRRASTQEQYYLFGHSAGGQFVHRFVFLGGPARYKLAIAANSGWYTLPTNNANWPYGLGGVSEDKFDQVSLLSKPLVIMVGDKDTDRGDKQLRSTWQAMEQGEHRAARAAYFIDQGQAEAMRLGVPFNWEFETVEGVGHDHRGMAIEAAALISEHHKQ